ncbi:MAG: phospholipase A [Lautropia sp.]|nr:phospholipase A [Lautropia sp.]
MNAERSSRFGFGLFVLALGAVGSAGAQTSGAKVTIPAGQAEDIQQAARQMSECAAIQDDASRLQCYDEMAASRMQPHDRELPAAASEDFGLKVIRDPAGPENEDGSVVQREGAASATGGSGLALPSFEPSPPDESRLLLDGRHAARAVQDVRRSLGTDLTDRWELDDASSRGRFVLRPYKPMYALLVDDTSRVNRSPSSPNPDNDVSRSAAAEAVVSQLDRLKRIEAKFQISFKTKVAENLLRDNGDLWVGYTQVSYWQIYTAGLSRPFRETNYEPEIMAVFRTHRKVGDWHWRMASIGLNHQSNGRSEPASRSWNRVILQFGLERERWTLMLRPWWRVPEAAANDDNPDISNYMGRGELLAVYRKGGHEVALTARHSLRLGSRSRGSVGLDYAFPISSYLKAHLQVFSGYGASMIDYNHRQTRVGLGVSLVQWL